MVSRLCHETMLRFGHALSCLTVPDVPRTNPATPLASGRQARYSPLVFNGSKAAGMHNELVFVDFETTGLSPDYDRVIEVAAPSSVVARLRAPLSS